MISPPPDPEIPDLVSTAEAARMLGISRQAVLGRAEKGTLLGRRAGGVWVFRRGAVEQAKAQDDLLRVTLSDAEKMILELLRTRTAKQVADAFQVTPSRISQVATAARAKLAAMTPDQRRQLGYVVEDE